MTPFLSLAAQMGQVAVVAIVLAAFVLAIARMAVRRRQRRLAALRQIVRYRVRLYNGPSIDVTEADVQQLRCEALRRDLQAAIDAERRRIERAPYSVRQHAAADHHQLASPP